MLARFHAGTALLAEDELPSSVEDALALAACAAGLPRIGRGRTREVWQLLAAIGAHDLGAVRALEPHLDAMEILEQARADGATDLLPHDEATWGVFAAEGGDDPLVATEQLGDGRDTWTLSGTKPWCSLASRLDSALVSARTDNGERRLFAVDLSHPGVHIAEGEWNARGLTEIPSGAVRFDAVPARAVGAPDWYLTRDGFSWGAIGVAACWYGGAVGIARTVHAAASTRPNPYLVMHLGAIDTNLAACAVALADAADRVDAGEPTRIVAKRVRALVAAAVDDVITRSGHALGPAPLALDAAHAKRVADLQLYVRQHHAEKDLASLGQSILEAGDAPW
ncbi:MAG: acyl-CoA dehydrogenase family protein [Microbacteriaceae bacterium]